MVIIRIPSLCFNAFAFLDNSSAMRFCSSDAFLISSSNSLCTTNADRSTAGAVVDDFVIVAGYAAPTEFREEDRAQAGRVCEAP